VIGDHRYEGKDSPRRSEFFVVWVDDSIFVRLALVVDDFDFVIRVLERLGNRLCRCLIRRVREELERNGLRHINALRGELFQNGTIFVVGVIGHIKESIICVEKTLSRLGCSEL
jgi:hypothetical protein